MIPAKKVAVPSASIPPLRWSTRIHQEANKLSEKYWSGTRLSVEGRQDQASTSSMPQHHRRRGATSRQPESAKPTATASLKVPLETFRLQEKRVALLENRPRPSTSRPNARSVQKRKRTNSVNSLSACGNEGQHKRPRREQAPALASESVKHRRARSDNGREKKRNKRSVGRSTAVLPNTGESRLGRSSRINKRKRQRSTNADAESVARAGKRRRVSSRAAERTASWMDNRKEDRHPANEPSMSNGVPRAKSCRTVTTVVPGDMPVAESTRSKARGGRKRTHSSANLSTRADKPAAKKQRRSRNGPTLTRMSRRALAASTLSSRRSGRKRMHSNDSLSTRASGYKPSAKKQRRARNVHTSIDTGNAKAGLRATGRNRGERMPPIKRAKKRGRVAGSSSGCAPSQKRSRFSSK